MSFYSFETITWTPEDGTVVVSDNTDYSFDGTSSKKLVWSDADKKVTIGFDSVTLSGYEEISLQIHQRNLLASGDTFKITVDSVVHTFDKLPRFGNGWAHVLLDCSSMGATTTIEIESLVDDLTLFIDYLGYRKTTHDRDLDVIEAIKAAISLDYDVATTITADVAASATSIALASKAYIYDSTVLRLDDGAGTTEDVALINRSGRLKTGLTNAFSAGDTVTALCPVELQDYDDLEADPLCGVMVYDKQTNKMDTQVPTVNKMKKKQFTGPLGVLVYIDCSSKKKLLQLAREYDYMYGERFCIILDGEQVDVILDNSQFTDNTLGNNPRVAYFYNVEPQPYLIAKGIPLTSLTVTPESKDPDLLYDTEVNS